MAINVARTYWRNYILIIQVYLLIKIYLVAICRGATPENLRKSFYELWIIFHYRYGFHEILSCIY